jgi:ZIP family zinc transporter
MPPDLGLIVAVAGAAALASVVGGALALILRPSTLVMSTVFGLAGGALLGTLAMEMLPQALDLTPLPSVVLGFGVGFLLVYGFDLVLHGGRVAGEHADQARRLQRRYRRHRPLAGTALVVAAATSIEEAVEGLTIGVAGVIEPALAGLIALAIALDNLSEGMAIGELFRSETGDDEAPPWRKTILWTGTVGVALLGSAIVGAVFLGDIDEGLLGLLVAGGAGAMLYLTLGDLLPEGQARHYQQSTALAAGTAFVLMLALSQAVG